MATPANVLALDPPEVSVASEKLPENSELIVAPLPVNTSSLRAANVALPDATGASLIALIVSLNATVAEEMRVVPPVAAVKSIAAALVIDPPLSIKFADNAVAEPL